MHTIQVQLTESQGRALEDLAARLDRSVDELVRDAVDMLLKRPVSANQEERERRALAAVGKFHSGHHDVSADHDRYLDDSYSRVELD